MKIELLLALLALVFACMTIGITHAKPLHSKLNYARYLKECKDPNSTLVQDLKNYFHSAAFNQTLELGLWTREQRSVEPTEDERQRFFMAKELVEELNQEHPEAEFTLESPFTLLTNDEFQQYVGLNSQGDDAESAFLGYRGPVKPTEANETTVESTEEPENHYAEYGVKEEADGRRRLYGFRQRRRNRPSRSDVDELDRYNSGRVRASYQFDDRYDDSKQPSGPRFAATSAPAPCPPLAPVAPSDPRRTTPTAPTKPSSKMTIDPIDAIFRPVGPVAPDLDEEDDAPVAPDPSDGSGVNWQERGFLTEVRNQGSCGSCWAMATVSAIESALCIKENRKGNCQKLSDQVVTSCNGSNGGCRGGIPSNAIEFVRLRGGLCTQQGVPYTGEDEKCYACPMGEFVKFSIDEAVKFGGDAATLKAALDKQPVVVAVAAGNTAWKQYKGGILTTSTCPSQKPDHAVLAYGYTDDAWLIKNSWGTKWGEQGMIRLSRDSDTCGILKSAVYPRLA